MLDIFVGDRFYFNSYGAANGQIVPDFLIVENISSDGMFVTARYENRAVDRRKRLFARDNLVFDSNLNPRRDDPTWIFVRAKGEKDGTSTVAQGSDPSSAH